MLANKSFDELDKMASYTSYLPIRTAEDLPLPLVTNTMDKDWKARIKDMFWSRAYEGEYPPGFEERIPLQQTLLSFGGEEVCMPFYLDDDVEKFITRGQLWYGDPHLMMEGAPSRCHMNSAMCWRENQDKVLIATGYALSDDGMWRQHSWCVYIHEDEGENMIIETTEPRVAYFGYVLNEEESFQFYMNNAL